MEAILFSDDPYKMKEKGVIIKRFVSSPNETNTYLLIDGNEAAVIDVANSYSELRDTLNEQVISLKYLLVTHGHPSHLGSIRTTKENLGGTICLHKSETDLLKEAVAIWSRICFSKTRVH